MSHTALMQKMIEFDAGDPRRIHHFLKVYAFAAQIGRSEGLDEATQSILETAAIIHDIGIHPAEIKYGSRDGKYQELEGPAPARAMLEELGYPPEVIERVCWLIAHHHTYTNVEGIDYQILLEADFLVNAYDDHLSQAAIRSFAEKVFRTKSGKELLHFLYMSVYEHALKK